MIFRSRYFLWHLIVYVEWLRICLEINCIKFQSTIAGVSIRNFKQMCDLFNKNFATDDSDITQSYTARTTHLLKIMMSNYTN